LPGGQKQHALVERFARPAVLMRQLPGVGGDAMELRQQHQSGQTEVFGQGGGCPIRQRFDNGKTWPSFCHAGFP